MTEHTVNPLESALSFLFPSSFEIFVNTAREMDKIHFPQSVNGLQKMNAPMILCSRLCDLHTRHKELPACVFTVLVMDEIFSMAAMDYRAQDAVADYLSRHCAHLDPEALAVLREDIRDLVLRDWSSDIEQLLRQSLPFKAANKAHNIRKVRPVFFRALIAAC